MSTREQSAVVDGFKAGTFFQNRLEEFERRKWSQADAVDRCRFAAGIRMAHPLLVDCINLIHTRERQVGDLPLVPGLFVCAPPGCGKTTLVEYLEACWPRKELEDRTLVPFIHFSAPRPCQPIDIVNAILKAIGDPDHQRKDLRLQLARAEKLMADVGVRVVAVDNAHDIPLERGTKGLGKVSDVLRDLACDAGRLLVLLGTIDTQPMLSSNPQLKRRVPTKKSLEYDVSSAQGLAQFLRVIDEMDLRLPLGCYSGLASRVGKALAIAADGKFSYLMQLLDLSIRRAVRDGVEALDIKIMSSAFAELFGEGSLTDPFKDSFSLRKLTLPGEAHFADDPAKHRRGPIRRGE